MQEISLVILFGGFFCVVSFLDYRATNDDVCDIFIVLRPYLESELIYEEIRYNKRRRKFPQEKLLFEIFFSISHSFGATEPGSGECDFFFRYVASFSLISRK